MRKVIAALCVLLLPATIFSQDQVTAPAGVDHKANMTETLKTTGSVAATPGATVALQYNFPGNIALRIGTDSMTDKEFCFASVESDMVAIDVAGNGAAVLGTPSDIDYEKPAMLRIDNDPPIPLNIQHQKHQFLFRGSATRQLLVPSERVEEFVLALYTRRRLRLRYSVFPGPGRYDEQLKFGDFAAAYDRGVELCAWPKLGAAAVHPSAEALADLMFPGTDSAPAEQEPAADPLAFYIDAVARILTTNWLAVRGEAQAGKASLAFFIERDGSVGSLPPIYSDLERACASAVRSSSPFPALPSGREGRLALHAECAGDSVKVSRLD